MDQTTQSQDHWLLKTRVDARHRHRFAYQQGRIRARYLFIITDLTHYPIFISATALLTVISVTSAKNLPMRAVKP